MRWRKNLNIDNFYTALRDSFEIDDEPSDSAEAILLEERLGDSLASNRTVSKEEFLKYLPAIYQVSYVINDNAGNPIDVDAPVSSAAILRALPKSWTAQEVGSFRVQLRTMADENGNLERQDAIDFIVEEVI